MILGCCFLSISEEIYDVAENDEDRESEEKDNTDKGDDVLDLFWDFLMEHGLKENNQKLISIKTREWEKVKDGEVKRKEAAIEEESLNPA